MFFIKHPMRYVGPAGRPLRFVCGRTCVCADEARPGASLQTSTMSMGVFWDCFASASLPTRLISSRTVSHSVSHSVSETEWGGHHMHYFQHNENTCDTTKTSLLRPSLLADPYPSKVRPDLRSPSLYPHSLLKANQQRTEPDGYVTS